MSNTLPKTAPSTLRMTFGRKVSVPDLHMCACGASSNHANLLVSRSRALLS